MRFSCRYCGVYWEFDLSKGPSIESQISRAQSEQCPTMLNGITHELRGDVE